MFIFIWWQALQKSFLSKSNSSLFDFRVFSHHENFPLTFNSFCRGSKWALIGIPNFLPPCVDFTTLFHSHFPQIKANLYEINFCTIFVFKSQKASQFLDRFSRTGKTFSFSEEKLIFLSFIFLPVFPLPRAFLSFNVLLENLKILYRESIVIQKIESLLFTPGFCFDCEGKLIIFKLCSK